MSNWKEIVRDVFDFEGKPFTERQGQAAALIFIAGAAFLASPEGGKARQAEYIQTIQQGSPETERLHIPAGLRQDFEYVRTHAPADGHTRSDAELVRETLIHYQETHGRKFDPAKDNHVPALMVGV